MINANNMKKVVSLIMNDEWKIYLFIAVCIYLLFTLIYFLPQC